MGFELGRQVKVHVSDWTETMSQRTESGGFHARALRHGESEGLLKELGYQMIKKNGPDQVWERMGNETE